MMDLALDFTGRAAIVTGGTGALGAAVVGGLIAAGASCIVPFVKPDEAERFPHRAHERVQLLRCGNLADENEVERLYAAAPRLWASIHLAGSFAMAPIAASDKALLMGQLEGNLATAYLCARAAAGIMAKTGQGGRIVNVAARPGLEWRSGAGMTAYAAAKAAVAAFTAALGEELAPERILVNAVAPSIMDTPANRRAMPKADFAAWPKVEEVAATILFLASPANGVTRSAVVPVYGRS
jgi:NAD(P)-dependent dehydrogenase (short-subunit alcohol dehydrogenase family)